MCVFIYIYICRIYIAYTEVSIDQQDVCYIKQRGVI